MLLQVVSSHVMGFNGVSKIEAAWEINQLLRKAKECKQHGEQQQSKHSDGMF